ncbi:hypothetical protein HDU93_001539, partial [Gonapodya sp. JEL0774]
HWAAEKRNREAAGDRDRNREKEREGTGGAGGAGGSGGGTTTDGLATSTTTTSSSSSKAAELAGKDGGVKVVVEGISRTVSLGKERGGFGGLVRWGGSDGEGIAGDREIAATGRTNQDRRRSKQYNLKGESRRGGQTPRPLKSRTGTVFGAQSCDRTRLCCVVRPERLLLMLASPYPHPTQVLSLRTSLCLTSLTTLTLLSAHLPLPLLPLLDSLLFSPLFKLISGTKKITASAAERCAGAVVAACVRVAGTGTGTGERRDRWIAWWSDKFSTSRGAQERYAALLVVGFILSASPSVSASPSSSTSPGPPPPLPPLLSRALTDASPQVREVARRVSARVDEMWPGAVEGAAGRGKAGSAGGKGPVVGKAGLGLQRPRSVVGGALSASGSGSAAPPPPQSSLPVRRGATSAPGALDRTVGMMVPQTPGSGAGQARRAVDDGGGRGTGAVEVASPGSVSSSTSASSTPPASRRVSHPHPTATTTPTSSTYDPPSHDTDPDLDPTADFFLDIMPTGLDRVAAVRDMVRTPGKVGGVLPVPLPVPLPEPEEEVEEERAGGVDEGEEDGEDDSTPGTPTLAAHGEQEREYDQARFEGVTELELDGQMDGHVERFAREVGVGGGGGGGGGGGLGGIHLEGMVEWGEGDTEVEMDGEGDKGDDDGVEMGDGAESGSGSEGDLAEVGWWLAIYVCWVELLVLVMIWPPPHPPASPPHRPGLHARRV